MFRIADKVSDVGRCARAVGLQREGAGPGDWAGSQCRVWWHGWAEAAGWSSTGGHCEGWEVMTGCSNRGDGANTLFIL